MDRPRRLMAQAAALARIEEMGRKQMTADGVTEARARDGADRERKAATRAMWALGDYHRFATELVWEIGPVLVSACGIAAGQRVLDVAAGTGNVAIRAAEAGARVVASDLTPEHFEAGRREARARGVTLEWVEGDAEALPFGDGEFDVVTSSFGAIFAPTTSGWPMSCCGSAGPGAPSAWPTSRPGGSPPSSSGSSRHTPRRRRTERCRRSCGAARSTCGSCSAAG
jgi:SAM-dependent methyltransferase